MEGKIKPTEAETQAHGMECVSHMMNGALGGMQLPQQ